MELNAINDIIKTTLKKILPMKLEDYFPTITIAIPCYNEANHIEDVISGFSAQGYENLREIVVADGGSDDGTQDIVKKLSLEDARVKLLHNPNKVQSAGLNLIFQKCQSDIFLRADAHSEYAPDYIQKCVNALQSSQALNVGGSQRHIAKNAFQAGVAIAFRSFLAGTAKFHNPNYSGYADTVYLGCFLTKSLYDIVKSSDTKELFDTTLVTNEDSELNLKLLNISEKAIYISSEIKVWYYPRNNLIQLFKQYFKYGRGRYLTAKKHPNNTPFRIKVPIIIIAIYLILAFFFLLNNSLLHFVVISFISLLFLLGFESIRVFSKYINTFEQDIWRGDMDKKPSYLLIFCWCFVALTVMPISYLLGNLYQRYRNNILRVNGH